MKSVLVIDDDKRMRDYIRLFLEEAGYTVHEAKNGREGMECFGKLRPDVVILDIFMPERDGLETIGDIKSDAGNCKILAISGGGKMKNIDILRYSKVFGANDILEKPFTGDELLAALENLS